MTNYYLEFDQFVRSVEISKADYFSFLLGAGASISSQIPSAIDCIWMWKRDIYSTQTGIQITDTELKSEVSRKAIQKWLNDQGIYPEEGAASEYQEFVERCYPIETDRSNFFKRICQGKQPSIGYKLLMLLHERGLLQSVWTTNFDELIYNSAIIAGVSPVDITLDAAGRIIRPQNKSELLVIKLHGDYRYGPLKNTENELADQDPAFREKLIDYLVDKHLVIAGYSGRDESIMSALKEAYFKKGAGRLYWCGYGRSIPDNVKELIDHARSNGRTAFYIPTDGFDKLMVGLTVVCVSDIEGLKNKYSTLLESEMVPEDVTPFSIDAPHYNTVIKSNLFQIDFPKEVLQLKIMFAEGERPWQVVRELTAQSQVVAVPREKYVWALGISSEIYDVFKDRIEEKLVRVPVVDWVPRKDTALHHLFLTALTRSLAIRADLESNGKDTIWFMNHESKRMIGESIYFIHQAIKLSIVFDGRNTYLAMVPHFHIIGETADVIINREIRTEIGRVYFEKIWNKAFNEYINEWRKRLLDIRVQKFDIEFPINSGTGFRFSIARTPAFGKIMFANSTIGVKLADDFPLTLLRFKGIQYKEPMLLFGQKHSYATVPATAIHPMKGLVNYRPYDHNSKSRLESESIQLGIICPGRETAAFSYFLKRIHSKIAVTEKQQQYLLEYPGFVEAYGISINVPDVGTRDWLTCQEPEVKSTLSETCLDLKNKIIRKIDEVVSDGIKKVVVICIPDRWLNYTSYDEEREVFDLHDFVKAYCAEKGIATQFIQEDTTRDALHCQINWWLSLSYFVKSLRTPWVLQDLDANTAFAGMGYSVNRKKDTQEIVLGCSHIYNAQGVGLKYRLSKLEDQLVWDRQDRPHLSYNDAYKFGLSIIDVFSATMEKFPDRVVIHKRNYFTQEEIKGLVDSLKGYKIKEIDLIEINFDESVRFISSKINVQGQPEIHGFPVTRGTCILLNKSEALLWTHGVVPAVNKEHYSFYLGGRYIPGPLKITKHYGKSNIGTIATEILGLTKVDWNSFHMYTKLPATISSSNEIARIGKLLSKREGANYDYRYFI